MREMNASRPITGMELVTRLFGVARRQKEALRQGRLEAFIELMDERARLFDGLLAADGALLRADREIQRLVEEILRVDGENSTILESLLAGVADDACRLAYGQRGAVSYLSSLGRPGCAGGILDGPC